LLKNLLSGKPALDIQCNNCQTQYESPYAPGVVLKFLEEFNAYENFASEPCPNCGTIELFNMNIPVNDTDGDLPANEETQRYYVRLLIRDAREDFKSA
jgi:hypothetical protein